LKAAEADDTKHDTTQLEGRRRDWVTVVLLAENNHGGTHRHLRPNLKKRRGLLVRNFTKILSFFILEN
jgi:hypothetical protein